MGRGSLHEPLRSPIRWQGESDYCFSIGLFLHFRPSFLIKRWR